MDTPVLRRDIQPVVTMVKGRQMIVFHDPYRLTDQSIALDINTLAILQLLDGKHDFRDIQTVLMKRQGGRIIYLAEIESFIETLDRACLLDSEFFNHKMDTLRSEFCSRQTRPPVYAGKAYPAEPEHLSRLIHDVENTNSDKDLNNFPDNISGILAPHIDIKVAGGVYVDTYRRLQGRHYDLVVILGINHHEQEGLFNISGKNYLTPYGEIETDRDFITALKKLAPEGTLAPDDFGHMIEHSIEFQTVFLHHYLQGPFSIVPILCGSIHEFIRRKEPVSHDKKFLGMAEAMKKLMRERKGNTLLVAGVDLSHVGRKFGDQLPADVILPQATENDRTILSLLTGRDAEGVFRNALETQDRYHVCGLPAILLLASLLNEDRAEILHFDTYHERETDSAVNYASVIFSSP